MKHLIILQIVVLLWASGIASSAGCSTNVTIKGGPVIQVDESQTVLPVTFVRMGNISFSVNVTARTNPKTAKDGFDFPSVTKTVEFGVDINYVTVNFTIVDDLKLENHNESFFINVTTNDTNVCTPFGSVIIQIKDNDNVSIGFHNDFRSFSENVGNISISFFKKLGDSSATVIALTVRYFTPGIGNATINTDYKNASNFISFAPSEQTLDELAALTIINNYVVEYTKCFNVSMDGTHPNIIFPRQSMICILNDDKVTIEFLHSNISVDEQLGFITVPVKKTGTSAIPITVRLNLRQDYSTAKMGVDYEDLPQKTITFSKDDSELSFNVTIKNDDVFESTESIIIFIEAIDASTTIIGKNNVVVLRIIDRIDNEIHLQQQKAIESEQERRTVLMTYLLFVIVAVLTALILIFIGLTCMLTKKMRKYDEM